MRYIIQILLTQLTIKICFKICARMLNCNRKSTKNIVSFIEHQYLVLLHTKTFPISDMGNKLWPLIPIWGTKCHQYVCAHL
jgi:hypothetical protein